MFDVIHLIALIGALSLGLILGGFLIKSLFSKEKEPLMEKVMTLEDALSETKETLQLLQREREDWKNRFHAEEASRLAFEKISEESKSQTAQLTEKLDGFQEEIRQLSAQNSHLNTRLEEQDKAHLEKITTLENMKSQIEQDLKVLTGEALQSNQKSFIEMANEIFAKHKEKADSDLTQRKDEIQTLLKPLNQTLEDYQKNLDSIEKNRRETVGNLSGELKRVIETQTEVRNETSKLVNALRAAPKTRGRWGEETLKNVMELSGMTQYCDFNLEQSFNTDEGKLRPDVIINLPGNRHIVVDAKTSTSAYMDAIEATNETDRETYLKQHTEQLKTHMRQLASKSYQNGLTVTPDFVAMFVPGDNFFSAAMERDPDLFETAVNSGVLIVTPTTLIALAKSVAFGWRQEKIADNARKVSELGRDLYGRLSKMGDHVLGMGKQLDTTVKRYNDFVGSLENSVMPAARKFNALEVDGTSKELQEPPALETNVREVRKDRDLEFAQLPFNPEKT